ncbi:hypothetical protein C8J57DRAFT_1726465 [Mycena rebaudengoi]|nr:hypothetical protein C8J57DRAFT_1726465 [Mycena rebaudengoi]
MPRLGAASRKYDNLLGHVASTVRTLQEISSEIDAPFIRAISGVTDLILTTVQSVQTNKEQCMLMLDQIHEILCAIINICVDGKGVLPPSTLQNIGRFAETLQKIQGFMRTQQDQGKLKRLFKAQENNALLEICKSELRQAADVLSIRTRLGILGEIADMSVLAERRQQEVLALMDAWRESGSESSSLGSASSYRFGDSSSSLLSMLPACPKIFYGRDNELQQVVDALLFKPAHIAILGTGGMGKTSLATAALHHPEVTSKYTKRLFVSCESAESTAALVVAIGSSLGLEGSKNTLSTILQTMKSDAPTLLVLDNLETPWEPSASRNGTEELLSKLTDLPNISLLVTMRGAERPGQVRWTRPFLAPLDALSDIAARQTFEDISEDVPPEETAHFDELLQLSGHLPLAVNLMANLVAMEGYATVLARWKAEKTALLSNGYDKRSSLEQSIQVSLSSPRLTPSARELLSLLSMLPDGISDAELHESALPIADLERARSTLLRTALAHRDTQHRRLCVLAPVREYVRAAHPPAPALVRPLRRRLRDMLDVWGKFPELGHFAPQALLNLGNISAVMAHGLEADPRAEPAELKETVQTVISLDTFSFQTLRGPSALATRLPEVMEKIDDEQLHGRYIQYRIFMYGETIPATEIEDLAAEGMRRCRNAQDVPGEAALNRALAEYYFRRLGDSAKGREFATRALELGRQSGNMVQQSLATQVLLGVMMGAGEYRAGSALAQDAQRLNRRLGRFLAEAAGMAAEAQCCIALGLLARGAALCAEARALVLACGMRDSEQRIAVDDIATDVHFLRTEYAECRAFHAAVVRDTGAGGARSMFHAYALASVAHMDILTGADEGAIVANLEEARRVAQAHRFSWGLLFCDARAADLCLRWGDLAGARDIYRRVLHAPGVDAQLAAWSLSRLGDPTRGLGRDAHDPFVYLAYVRLKSTAGTYDALRCVGDVFMGRGDERAAGSVFEVALDGFTGMDVHLGRATCMERLGGIYLGRGDEAKARELWEGARPLYVRASQRREAGAIEERLRRLRL